MCVAIYKTAGIKTPSLETLKECWNANPDGAGFAMRTPEGSKYSIHIRKGFMQWKDFEKAYRKNKLDTYEGELLLHFRIATHGGISPGNTHPFPVTEDIKLLQHTNILTDYALIHNGMLPIEPEFRNISDTMEFCRRLSNGNFYRKIPETLQLLEGFIRSNKIAVMTRDTVHLAGDWENIEGVYYSNTLWQKCFPDMDWDEHWPDEYELRHLQQGICPDCHGEVIRDESEFYCMECDGFWVTNRILTAI